MVGYTTAQQAAPRPRFAQDGPVVEIEWVNHASYVLRHNGVSVLVDPWLEGSAFNDGWELLVPSVFDSASFEGISHLWFSHEHPDHFSPSTLKTIGEGVRPRLTVLYQRTKDQRVVDFCKKQGYDVREVADGEWVSLGEDARMMLGKVSVYDSWALTEVDGLRILNLNDCVFNGPRALQSLREKVGTPDVLLSQFSYANWVGNPEDGDAMLAAAAQKLGWLDDQLDCLKPRYCIPFASYSVFAHEENAYLNECHNHVEAAVRIIEKHGVRPIVLWPGERWDVGTDRDSRPAIAQYAAAWKTPRNLRTSPSKSLEELEEVGREYCARIKSRNNRAALAVAGRAPFHVGDTLSVHLTDHDDVVVFDLRKGLRPVDTASAQATVSMHSQSLWFALKFDFGIDTLSVNGRFRTTPAGYNRMIRTFGVSVLNNAGYTLGPGLLRDTELLRWVFNRFMRRA